MVVPSLWDELRMCSATEIDETQKDCVLKY